MIYENESLQRTIIRGVWLLLVAGICFVVKLIARRINHLRVNKFLNRLYVLFLLFVLALFIGNIIDNYLGFKVAWLTSMVNLSFWCFLFCFSIFIYFQLKKSQKREIEITNGQLKINPNFIDTEKVASLIDELLFELKLQKQMQINMKENLESKLQDNLETKIQETIDAHFPKV